MANYADFQVKSLENDHENRLSLVNKTFLQYGKYPKILQTSFHTFFALILLFMQLFLKIHSEMAICVGLDQLIWVCTVCISHWCIEF